MTANTIELTLTFKVSSSKDAIQFAMDSDMTFAQKMEFLKRHVKMTEPSINVSRKGDANPKTHGREPKPSPLQQDTVPDWGDDDAESVASAGNTRAVVDVLVEGDGESSQGNAWHSTSKNSKNSRKSGTQIIPEPDLKNTPCFFHRKYLAGENSEPCKFGTDCARNHSIEVADCKHGMGCKKRGSDCHFIHRKPQ